VGCRHDSLLDLGLLTVVVPVVRGEGGRTL
jgi:hypothetical protein